MIDLLKKARRVFLILIVVYIAGFGAGFLAGKAKAVDIQQARTSRLFELNRSLEYQIPGYGDLLKRYKDWHGPTLMKLLTTKNAAGLGLLIFFNNFVMANLTMAVRAALLAPLFLYPYGRFLQGVVVAQTPASGRVLPLLIMEFGGYLLVIGAVLCAWVWTLWPRRFGFASRAEGLRGGLKMLGFLWLVSGVFLAAGAVLEARMMLGLMGG